MSTTARTEALYTALEQALGVGPTETLMELLSRDDDTAIRADLAVMRSEVAEEFERISARFAEVEARFEQIDTRFEKIDTRFEDLNATFHSYARMFVVVHTTSVLAVAAMVLGVIQLM